LLHRIQLHAFDPIAIIAVETMEQVKMRIQIWWVGARDACGSSGGLRRRRKEQRNQEELPCSHGGGLRAETYSTVGWPRSPVSLYLFPRRPCVGVSLVLSSSSPSQVFRHGLTKEHVHLLTSSAFIFKKKKICPAVLTVLLSKFICSRRKKRREPRVTVVTLKLCGDRKSLYSS
jgi:hypothetical protein